MESKEEKRERWRLLVEQYQRCKKTQRAFCKSQGLTLWVFRYWLRKYDNQLSTPIEKTPQRLLPVRVNQTITPSTSPMVLAFPSGLELKFTYSGLTEDLGALAAQLHRVV